MNLIETSKRSVLFRFMRHVEGTRPAMTYDGAAQINRLSDGEPAAYVFDLKTVAIVAED